MALTASVRTVLAISHARANQTVLEILTRDVSVMLLQQLTLVQMEAVA